MTAARTLLAASVPSSPSWFAQPARRTIAAASASIRLMTPERPPAAFPFPITADTVGPFPDDPRPGKSDRDSEAR